MAFAPALRDLTFTASGDALGLLRHYTPLRDTRALYLPAIL
jgi:hypothetical protein